jgi:hypothetical protein
MWQASVQWQAGPLRGEFVPSNSSDGIRIAGIEGTFLALTLGDTRLPDCTESYLRGNDVFVDCPADDRQIGVQAYYRDLPEQSGIELIVSAQTDALGIPIPLRVISTTAMAPQQKSGDHWIPISDKGTNVVRWSDNEDQVVAIQIVHPSDFQYAAVHSNALSCELFGESMEKGVIRRGRVRCYFARPGYELTDARIDALTNEFQNAAPPLTT